MRRPEQIDNFSLTLFSIGGLIFAVICIVTVQDLSDQTVHHIFLPGTIMAIPWLVAGVISRAHKSHRKRSSWHVFKSHRM